MSIARYKQDYEDTYAASDGEWVTYADHAASLADAQAEIARLRGALEACQRYALEFPDSLLRDNLLDTAADALK